VSSANRWRLGARRDRAARYLIVTIAAFAVTVGGVRWFLDMSGYPTVGGGDLHVAHVLWGGLVLFIAALLPLLYVGSRTHMVSALLAGIGAGLFIDEVGKFLTSSNDYFYAPAAPIIYGSILLLVLLAFLVRRRGVDHDDATHAVIEALRDGTDGRLTQADRKRAIRLAQDADVGSATGTDDLQSLLVAALESAPMDARLASDGWVARGRARFWLERILPTRLERWLVYISLIQQVLVAAVSALILWASSQEGLIDFSELATDSGRLEFPTEPIWTLMAIAINVVVGVAAMLAIVLLLRGRKPRGLDMAVVALLTSLVAGGLVTFYAVQFTALSSTVLAVLQLGLVVDLRIRLANATVEATDR
jgi:hypothetical protein